MTKIIAPLVAILMAQMFTAVSGSTAMAQYSRGRVFCPPGTCAKDGSSRAKDLKFCKKENCRKK